MDAIKQRIAAIRSKPLLVLCVFTDGERIATVDELIEKNGRYIQIVADELDALLAEKFENRKDVHNG